MGKFRIEITKLAQQHLAKHYKSGNKPTIKKIEKMLLELSETPYSGIGNPEALKWELTGYWSRRINQKDRLIYKVAEELVIVYVVSASGHYEDQ
ncbi:MAG: Txe/YoeB family addiction module toxin [Flavobacterium sp.]|jgi:toxin YoeB|nr:Txe/YoeB family addiction module toxin [Flavobacterium sp.]